jgi:hypothetical protein
MSDPLGRGIVGFSTSEKQLDYGWAQLSDLEQLFQRLTRNLRQIDAMVHHQFAADPTRFLGLRFAYFGGMIDGGNEWILSPAGTIDLPDNATTYIERSSAGVVRARPIGFAYPDWIPMYEVDTLGGAIADVRDRRPELGTGASAGGGAVTFSQIIGVILNSQVPLSAVAQWQSFLSIAMSQLTGVLDSSQLPDPLLVDVINERTADVGVTIEGVLLKDGEVALAKKAVRLDDTGVTPKLLYLGKAAPGSTEGAAVWAIQRITFASDGDATVEWADGNGNEDNIWTNRLSLSYS